VHDLPQLRRAERQGADLVFISPLFATRSHPGKRPLGPVRFAALASRAHVPVMALGGVGPRHVRLTRMLGASGYGAIDSLIDRK
jgi:thiamine-phosphate pyrophosphorylase